MQQMSRNKKKYEIKYYALLTSIIIQVLSELELCSMRHHTKYLFCTQIWPFDLQLLTNQNFQNDASLMLLFVSSFVQNKE